jgi:hypothetical protein
MASYTYLNYRDGSKGYDYSFNAHNGYGWDNVDHSTISKLRLSLNIKGKERNKIFHQFITNGDYVPAMFKAIGDEHYTQHTEMSGNKERFELTFLFTLDSTPSGELRQAIADNTRRSWRNEQEWSPFVQKYDVVTGNTDDNDKPFFTTDCIMKTSTYIISNVMHVMNLLNFI